MAATQNSKAKKWLAQMEGLFKACADQTRLRILHLLACEGEICVRDLVEVLQTSQPKISRHLAYLKRAGLVTDRKDGLWVNYRLTAPLPTPVGRMLECLTSCYVEVPEMHQEVLRLQAIRSHQPLPQQTVRAAFIVVEEEPTAQTELLRVELL